MTGGRSGSNITTYSEMTTFGDVVVCLIMLTKCLDITHIARTRMNYLQRINGDSINTVFRFLFMIADYDGDQTVDL